MKFLIVSLALVTVACAQYQQRESQAAILRQTQDVSPDGAYSYDFETENGIYVAEVGAPRPVGPNGEVVSIASGVYQFTDPQGNLITTSYVADENGFYPDGAHIPESIKRALDYIRSHPSRE